MTSHQVRQELAGPSAPLTLPAAVAERAPAPATPVKNKTAAVDVTCTKFSTFGKNTFC